MKNVNYKSLRKFDLGTIGSTGYQANTSNINAGAMGSTPGYNISNDASAIRSSILPTVISGAAGLAPTASNLATNWTKDKGLNTLGKVAGVAGGVMGTLSMINDFTGFSDRLRGGDLQNMSATSTQTKNGVNYTTYDGFNANQVRDYTSAQNTQSTLSATMNGISAGASFGSLGGPIGSAIGAGIGGLVGLVGGLFGSDSRKKKVERDIKNTLGQQAGYNEQAESEAGSLGLKNQFYASHADEGKRPGESLSGGKFGVIQTPSGPAYGEIQGLASPDEGQIDMVTGETSYNGSKNMNVIDRRADVVPVGITGYANGGAFDNNVGIPGHQLDVNGLSFADNARPLFKQNEQLKDVSAAIDMKLDENENHKTRDKATKQFIEKRLNQKKEQVQQKYQQNAQGIADIVNRQTAMTSGAYFNCGKTPRYEDGKSGNDGININPFRTSYAGLSPIYGALQSLPYAISDTLAANKHTPYAQNSYVANPTAQQSLNVLGSLRYDPTRQLDQITSATRQSQYNINNAGSLSAGQRAALASSGLIQAAQARNAIYDKAGEVNNGYRTAYANALMGYGQDEASRMQQANAYQQEAYRQAVGAKQKLQAQARKNWYTLGRQNLQDFNTWLNTQGMLNLWDRRAVADEAKVGIKRPTTTTTASTKAQVRAAKKAEEAVLKQQIKQTKQSIVKRQMKKGVATPPDAMPDYRSALPFGGATNGVDEFNYYPWQKPIIRPGSDLWMYHYGD